MYAEYFGLKEPPFSIAPDPAYLYMSEAHREALSHVLFGLRGNGGFILLTGEIGAGKTTICRCVLEKVPSQTDIAFVLNPMISIEELLATICDELCIPYPKGLVSIKEYVDLINSYLLDAHAKGRNTVIIIEEAQNLTPGVLEHLRLLTNLETNKCKLLQIILLGQPELREMLARPELKQLSQRITARYHLGPLSRSEVSAYVQHRLSVAGSRSCIFSSSALRRLYRLSGGIPRIINLICDRALLGAYSEGRRDVDSKTIAIAAGEVSGGLSGSWKMLKWAFAGALLAVSCVAFSWTMFRDARSGVQSIASQEKNSLKPVSAVQNLFSALPDNISGPEGRAVAYKMMLSAWKLQSQDMDPEKNCDQITKHGLRCIDAQGDMAALRRINRPSVLRLRLADGTPAYVTLFSLGSRSAAISNGSMKRTIPLSELELLWTGDFMAVQRVAPDFDGSIFRGDSGTAVSWLEGQLSRINGRQPVMSNTVYDATMEREIREYQRREGLSADGIAGPLTLMKIQESTVRMDPVLLTSEGGI